MFMIFITKVPEMDSRELFVQIETNSKSRLNRGGFDIALHERRRTPHFQIRLYVQIIQTSQISWNRAGNRNGGIKCVTETSKFILPDSSKFDEYNVSSQLLGWSILGMDAVS
ncbi:Hypothetical_protein [Hexamita inflata]|uniref:Hypothetical_protein n=1 Tax=Hexamita inflata TaxID=28002 RepID=A0AA86QK33_9EUKA|nr:Hypothetical protein HINF_LOCUS42189 [Hexamita inflata]